MKKNLWKIGVFGMAIMTLAGCDSDEDMTDLGPKSDVGALTETSCDAISFESVMMGEFVSEVYSANGVGPVMVINKARNSNGELQAENRATIFDTGHPTGDDDDLWTPDWGKVLIIQELGKTLADDPNVEGDGPNDNQWGGEMELTFPKAMTMTSMKVLDIDTYEDNSWVYLYDAGGKELFKASLKPLGNMSQQTVNFGNTAGVMKMKVVLAGSDSYAGSGAIDDLMFCVTTETPDEVYGCTRTQGYWKNHANPDKKQYDSTWDDYLGKAFFNSGKDYLAVLQTAPKGGNEYYILAHQYIAAELNVAAGASIPTEVHDAWLAAQAYFKGETSPSRAEIIAWAELLDDYNNGKVGPGHCD